MSWGDSGPQDRNLDRLGKTAGADQSSAAEALKSFREWFLTTTFLGAEQMATAITRELDNRISAHGGSDG